MRTTWERLIEEVLFNKVIQRFQPEIKTQRLRGAAYESETHYPGIFNGMKRTSHYSGHDLAEDLPNSLPGLAVIDSDIQSLRDFFNTAKERRKKLDNSYTYEEPPEPELI